MNADIAEVERNRLFEAAQAENKRSHELLIRRERAHMALNKAAGLLEVVEAKEEVKESVPRYKKY